VGLSKEQKIIPWAWCLPPTLRPFLIHSQNTGSLLPRPERSKSFVARVFSDTSPLSATIGLFFLHRFLVSLSLFDDLLRLLPRIFSSFKVTPRSGQLAVPVQQHIFSFTTVPEFTTPPIAIMSPGVVENAPPQVTLTLANGAPAFDFEAIYTTIFDAKTSHESLDAATTLCDGIAADPVTAHHALSILLPRVAKAAADKKSGTNRESAMIVYGAMYESLPHKAPATEVQLVATIGNVFDGLADKGSVVRESAQYAIDALFAGLKQPVLVSGLLVAVMDYLRSSASKWQGKVGALMLIGKLAEKAVKIEQNQGEVFLKDAMGRELEALIPVVESGMHDLKAEVRTGSWLLIPRCLLGC